MIHLKYKIFFKEQKQNIDLMNKTKIVEWSTSVVFFWIGRVFLFSCTFHLVCGQCPPLIFEGRTYQTVQIGDQCWMAENFAGDVGEAIEISDVAHQAENQKRYGKLYDWDAAMEISQVVSGWHLPTDGQWQELESYLGIRDSELDSLGWRGVNQAERIKVGGKTGFDAQLAGYTHRHPAHDSVGRSEFGKKGYFWTATRDGLFGFLFGARFRAIEKGNDKIMRQCDYHGYRFSVRLMRD